MSISQGKDGDSSIVESWSDVDDPSSPAKQISSAISVVDTVHEEVSLIT